MDMQKLKNQKGFTLVEIAIVLVIIGLLLGGVLKGQELIENTKIKAVKSDADKMMTAINGYQDRFRAMPGDDASADDNVNGGTVATTDGTVGNGIIEGDFDETNGTAETSLIYQHLRLAGFISGNGTDLPTSAFGGVLGITNTAGGGTLTGTIICQTGMTDNQMELVDIRYDDGAATTGSIIAVTAADAIAANADYQNAAFDGTVLCMQY